MLRFDAKSATGGAAWPSVALRLTLALAAPVVAAACVNSATVRKAAPADTIAEALPEGVAGLQFDTAGVTPERLEVGRTTYTDVMRRKWEAEGSPPAGVRSDILAISGGGPDGAFAAGLVTGWTIGGGRPRFDLVTGISVGALIAPFVFAGPDYDPTLEAIFTQLGTDNVAEFAPVSALFGALGLADTTPLRRTIASYVDKRLLERVAAEDRSGRSLLIGTTDIDRSAPVIWDMGAIAKAGLIELFRDVMLASASIPGAFPPVGIEVEIDGETYTEFHVDGGVTHNVIVWPSGFDAVVSTDLPFPVRQTIWLIQNNTLTPDLPPVESDLASIAARSLSTLIRSQSVGDIEAIHRAAMTTGSEFRLVFVPAEMDIPGATSFDREAMRRLFTFARDDAADGLDWLSGPPGLVCFRSRSGPAC